MRTTRTLAGAGLYAVMVVLPVACADPGHAPPAPAEPEELLPAVAEFPGWRLAAGPDIYLPDRLYEYLNGGAERYQTCGFRTLVHVRYQRGEDSLAGVTFDIFDMGGKLGAFAMFRSALPADAALTGWCTEGYRSGTLATAWKEAYYLRAEADEDSPELLEARDGLMTSVCARIRGAAALPAVIGLLPREGRVDLSERWVGVDLLGHAFLGGGVTAAYDVSGDTALLFLSDAGSEAEAIRRAALLRAHHAQWGEVLGDVRMGDAEGFRYTDPTLGNGTVVHAGKFVAGVHGAVSHGAEELLLARLVEEVRNRSTIS